MPQVDRLADRIAAAVLPLTLLAAGVALVAPSRAAAEHADWLLAALVLLTALGIDPRRLEAVRRRPRAVAGLSVGTLVVLAPVAWALSRLFDDGVRDGLLALGVAPTEVAAVGLVALAGADAVLALAVVAGSLVASAALGPSCSPRSAARATCASARSWRTSPSSCSRRSPPASPPGRPPRRSRAANRSTERAGPSRSRRWSTPR